MSDSTAPMPRARAIELIAIGTSSGAVGALSAILPKLPRALAVPIVVVVHLPPGRDSRIAAIFAGKCEVPVKEAEDKEPLSPGTIYFAPPDYHLLIEKEGCLSLSSEEPVRFSRPSIDVLFESAADACGTALLAIILTGANDDGAAGTRAVCEAGGQAIVQNPASAESPAMPAAALAACPSARRMELIEIAELLQFMV